MKRLKDTLLMTDLWFIVRANLLLSCGYGIKRWEPLPVEELSSVITASFILRLLSAIWNYRVNQFSVCFGGEFFDWSV